MHLQTVNRDQRRKTLPRQRGEEAEETAPFFFLPLCRSIVNILLCPASLLLPFILQSFWRYCAFSTPQVHSHPKTLSVSVPPPPTPLPPPLSPYTSWFSYLPQVHQMIPLLQRSFCLSASRLGTWIFWFWLYFKEVLRQPILLFLSLMCTCRKKTLRELKYTEKALQCTAVKHDSDLQDIYAWMQRQSNTSLWVYFWHILALAGFPLSRAREESHGGWWYTI